MGTPSLIRVKAKLTALSRSLAFQHKGRPRLSTEIFGYRLLSDPNGTELIIETQRSNRR